LLNEEQVIELLPLKNVERRPEVPEAEDDPFKPEIAIGYGTD
jgi:hypothetical protein